MDIQVSSNLERLLFDLLDRDGDAVASLLDRFRSQGTAALRPELHQVLAETWSGYCFGDQEVLRCIAAEADRSGTVLDPHTAVGVLAARAHRDAGHDAKVEVVALATAHPSKFPDAVEQATGVRPSLPDRLADLFDRSENLTYLPNDLSAVEAFVAERSRVG